MALLTSTTGIRFSRGLNPRRNLPSHTARKRGESNFALAFERAYFQQRKTPGVVRREFDFAGYGIADLVWLFWPSPEMAGEGGAVGIEQQLRSFRVTAFEMKLRDWRKALAQAFRYSYFADTAVVVLPPATAVVAREAIAEFRRLKVGLWAFDARAGTIKRLYTPPRKNKARSNQAREKAVASLLSLAKLRQLPK